MFVFTVLFSKYFEVYVELCGTRKFMFSKVGRDLKSLGTTALQHCNKIPSLRKNQHKIITLTICKTEFRENICLKIVWSDGRHLNMINYFGKAITALSLCWKQDK